MSINLDQYALERVKQILKKNGIQSDVYIFGSRARGDNQEYSDLDILLKLAAPLESLQLVRLKSDFAESDLPITTDIVEWLKISEDFRNKIKSEMILLVF